MRPYLGRACPSSLSGRAGPSRPFFRGAPGIHPLSQGPITSQYHCPRVFLGLREELNLLFSGLGRSSYAVFPLWRLHPGWPFRAQGETPTLQSTPPRPGLSHPDSIPGICPKLGLDSTSLPCSPGRPGVGPEALLTVPGRLYLCFH